MMDWEDVRVQLVDLPPITADVMEGYVASQIRSADAALLVVDLSDDDGPFTAEAVLDKLADTKTRLVAEVPDDDDFSIAYVPTLLLANKSDADGASDRLSIVREMFAQRFGIYVAAAESGDGLAELRTAIYQFLKVMRVYSKHPGKPPEKSAPFTCPIGSTVHEFAGLVHRDFEEKLKSARVWGAGVFDGQTVKRDHVLHDGDIVELHL
jgi:ribosome-interacting GTPase 1